MSAFGSLPLSSLSEIVANIDIPDVFILRGLDRQCDSLIESEFLGRIESEFQGRISAEILKRARKDCVKIRTLFYEHCRDERIVTFLTSIGGWRSGFSYVATRSIMWGPWITMNVTKIGEPYMLQLRLFDGDKCARLVPTLNAGDTTARSNYRFSNWRQGIESKQGEWFIEAGTDVQHSHQSFRHAVQTYDLLVVFLAKYMFPVAHFPNDWMEPETIRKRNILVDSFELSLSLVCNGFR